MKQKIANLPSRDKASHVSKHGKIVRDCCEGYRFAE